MSASIKMGVYKHILMHKYNYISKQAPQECSKNKSQQNCNEFLDWKNYFLDNLYVKILYFLQISIQFNYSNYFQENELHSISFLVFLV